MRVARWLPYLATAALAVPVLAQESEKPITDKEVTATDVAATPVTDLNLRKDEIPALLVAAQERPYALNGLTRCTQIVAQIVEFDAVLGDDIDLPQGEARRTSPGRVAQSVVGSLIPFRGVIREISGANKQQRMLQAAIQAGIARRAFLKGVGQARGCRYPARSATAEVFSQRLADLQGETLPSDTDATNAPRQASQAFESKPIVQNVTGRR